MWKLIRHCGKRCGGVGKGCEVVENAKEVLTMHSQLLTDPRGSEKCCEGL